MARKNTEARAGKLLGMGGFEIRGIVLSFHPFYDVGRFTTEGADSRETMA